MPLPSFTITGTLFDLLGNVAAGEIIGNGLGGATPATVTFTSNVPQGYFVTFAGVAYRVDEVTGIVNNNGTITHNGDPVQLLANDAGLSVEGLQWQCHVAGMHRFWFNAPVDGGTVNLGTVVPVPGLGVAGVAFSEGELVTLLADSGSPVRAALDALYITGHDEYHEYANLAAFPGTGVADRIYVAQDTGKFYHWTGSAYAQIAGNAATALKLFTARNINGVAFDGTADITVADSTKQPLDSDLTAIAALTSAANKVPYSTGAGAWALADFTAAGRALVDDADAAAQRATLGGTTVGGNVFTAADKAAARTAITAVGALSPFRTRQAVVCFTFDDCFTEDFTVIKPRLDTAGIKGGFPITSGPGGGVCPGSSGHLTWAQVLQLQTEGHEILAHSQDHGHLGAFAGMSDAATLAEIDNRALYEAHGINVRGFAYPFGEHDAALRKVVRDHYDYGLGTVTGASGSEAPMSTYAIRRVAIKDVTVTSDLTAMVDAAIVNKEILVFIVHSGTAFGEFTSAGGGWARLDAVIAYCQSVTVPILTPGQAFDLVGPILDTGDYPALAKYSIIDSEGNPHFPPPDNTLPHASDALTRLPATFTRGQVVQQYNSSTGAPGNGPGVVWTTIVDQTNTAGGLNFQLYIRNGNNGIWVRSATTDNSAWTVWVKLDTDSLGLITSAGATTALTASSAKTQLVTGTLTQTIVLGTTGVIAGQPHKIINNSTGVVTVQSSNTNVLGTLATGRSMVFDALIDTPTTSSHWGKSFTPTALTDLDTTVTGSQLNADHTKLAGVATGATANSPDATLLDRANHTGTQLASTISDLTVGSDDLTTGEGTMSRRVVNTVCTLSSGIMRLTYFTAKKTETVTQVRSRAVGAAATPTLCRIGVYSIDGSGNLTLIASTATDTALWSVANTTYTKSFSASWSKVRGTRYAVGKLYVGTTAPTTPGLNPGDGDELAVAPRLCAALGGQTDLPASVTTGSLSVGTQQPYSALLP